MRKIQNVCGLIAAGLLMAASWGCNANIGFEYPADDERGFITLFDGTSTEGWVIMHDKGNPIRKDAWYAENGIICCKAYNGFWYRYEAREFDDFILRFEYRITEGTNSGVCIRSAKEGHPAFTGFEVQIIDDIGMPAHKHSTGSLYDVVTPMYNENKPLGQWNEMEIACKGHLVRITLNGLKVVDTDLGKLTKPRGKYKIAWADLPLKGYIGFQDHGTPVWFRNVRIKPL